ncbi:ubiquitinyl hydrolase 1 [Anaeramoeba ignava]|uniref:Ubiquitinyl hydrolase 1 n=1 Tax=Anaeramoeba ignava TaxID=1746090 RepID=A0A9Q0RAR7_ANAIG|nr:ubiquitinyl hydrolase 1 [Anaeramoeba ignava]
MKKKLKEVSFRIHLVELLLTKFNVINAKKFHQLLKTFLYYQNNNFVPKIEIFFKKLLYKFYHHIKLIHFKIREIFGAPDSYTLTQCFSTLFEIEKLKGSNKYFCSFCKRKNDALKMISIKKFPEFLIIHLKRFAFSGNPTEKINNRVIFPLKNLDLSQFAFEKTNVENSYQYNLYSVIVHLGQDRKSGHFITYSKRGEVWFELNDSNVSHVSQETVSESQAYILFYQKIPSEIEERKKYYVFDLIQKNLLIPPLVSISGVWMLKLSDFSNPGRIHNSDLLCKHGNFKYISTQHFPFETEKRITSINENVFEQITSIYGKTFKIESSQDSSQECLECFKEELHKQKNKFKKYFLNN